MGKSDSEYINFAQISSETQKEYTSKSVDVWAGSPFAWIRNLSSRRKGAVGEKLVQKWSESHHFTVRRTGDSEADRIIAGARVEIKLSTLWESGSYKFQQIRDQDYEFIFLLGLSPNDVHAWFVPKHVLKKHVIGVLGQHTGADGSDTAWITVTPGHEPIWLKPYGQTLEDVKILIQAIAKQG